MCVCVYILKLIQREKYRLRVRAADKGDPPSSADVDVDLDVVDRNNKPPIWDSIVYGPKHIKENVPINTVVASVKARFVKLKRKFYELLLALLTRCYSNPLLLVKSKTKCRVLEFPTQKVAVDVFHE